MTEQVTQQEQPNAVEFFQLKQQMIAQLNINYKAFMDSLRTFPVMQGALNFALQNFETGLVWMEKGISLVPLQTVPVSQPQAPESVAESATQEV